LKTSPAVLARRRAKQRTRRGEIRLTGRVNDREHSGACHSHTPPRRVLTRNEALNWQNPDPNRFALNMKHVQRWSIYGPLPA